jgi:hypothetical protein
MASRLTIYQLVWTGGDWSLDVLATQPPANVLRRRYSCYRVLDLAGRLALAAYAEDEPDLDLYFVSGTDMTVSYAVSLKVGPGWDFVDGFTFSNTPYVMTYRADVGVFGFYSLDSSLAVNGSYEYSRSHAPAATHGFTMVRPFEIADGVMIMGYSSDTGAICVYRLAARVSSPPSAAPIAMHTVRDQLWTPGWTRFAFFTLGGEVFFLKTNVKYPNVNIDHVLDSAEQGTSEVATNLSLEDFLTLSIVESFAIDNGHPHFVAYRPDGLAVIYRIHSTARGWSRIAEAQTESNAIAFAPAGGDGHSQLFLELTAD